MLYRAAMTSENLPISAIVFSCDEAYAFLARGLVLSLADGAIDEPAFALWLADNTAQAKG